MPRQSKPDAAAAPEEAPVSAFIWSLGDHAKQVPLAGLLVQDPSLREAELTPSEWRDRLDEYLRSPAP